MSTTIQQQVKRRTKVKQTFASELAAGILAVLAAASTITWPNDRYRNDPVAFFREVLGVEPWEKQVEICEAVRDHGRVAVASGHKVSKSHTDAGIALWFYCSFEDARVIMSSVTSRQVDQILWRELRMMFSRAVQPIDGEMHELARSGLKSKDFREIVGFTAKEAEAVAGISGRNLLYILDEASGIPDLIFEAIEGNRAGGARILMTSNPTRTEGEFFDAFHEKKDFYKTLQVSSEDTPNVRAGRTVIAGLATREWVEEKKLEWGEDSPLYKVRVKGQFVLKEEGKVISLHLITASEDRWDDEPYEGRLQIGLDPAGPGGGGDESVFGTRRGRKIGRLLAFRGLNDEGHLVQLLSILKDEKKERDQIPVVVIDREGPIGSSLFGFLRNYADANPTAFELCAVRASDRAQRRPDIYDRMRDELWASLQLWLRDGAIPEDAKLAKELHCPDWIQIVNGKLKVTGKDEMKKVLKRSPDRADAVALATWEPLALQREVQPEKPADTRRRRVRPDPIEHEVKMDPYAADAWSHA